MDIKRVKQLAGLEPIVEAWDDGDFDRFMNGDDEDDLSDAERELVGQAERDLAAKGVKVKNVDPEADISALARTRAPEAEDDVAPAPAPEVDDLPRGPAPGDDPELSAAEEFPHADEVDTPEEIAAAQAAPAPAAAAPDAQTRGEKVAKAREYFAINPGATRGEFMTFAARELGMGKNYANVLYYKVKPKPAAAPAAINPAAPMEVWVIKNEKGKVLSESGTYDLPLWADFLDTRFDAKVFESELYAKKAIDALAKYGFKKVVAAKETF